MPTDQVHDSVIDIVFEKMDDSEWPGNPHLSGKGGWIIVPHLIVPPTSAPNDRRACQLMSHLSDKGELILIVLVCQTLNTTYDSVSWQR